jgi:hypothetical protein
VLFGQAVQFMVSGKRRTMFSSRQCLHFLILLTLVPSSFLRAQDTQPVPQQIAPTSIATRSNDEVEELRQEVAAQRQMIHDLQATVQQLVKSTTSSVVDPGFRCGKARRGNSNNGNHRKQAS